MMGFWRDKIAITFASVGLALMILTIVWRINPVEGSVVPGFLTGNPFGVAVMGVLLVTCMPVWILVVSLPISLPLTEHTQYTLACAIMIVLQVIAYFLTGKLVSICVRKMSKKKITSN